MGFKYGLQNVFNSFKCFKMDFLIECALRPHIYIIEENEIKPNWFLIYNTLKVSFNLPKNQQQKIMFWRRMKIVIWYIAYERMRKRNSNGSVLLCTN